MSTSRASLVIVHVEVSLMSRLSKKYVNACSPQSLGITVYRDLTSMVNRKRCPGSVKYMKCVVGVLKWEEF